MPGPDALELAGQVAGDLGRGVVDGPGPAAMAGPGPGLPQPGGALAGQLDLDRHPLGQRVDVLAVQAGAGLGLGVVGELDGGVGDVALAGLAAQLPLRQPAATGGDAWLQGQADDADGVDVGELGDDEGPGAHVQADQPQRLGGGGDPQVAEQAVAGDQAAVLPAVQHVAQGRLAELALDPGRAGRQPAEQDAEDVGAGRVLLAEPAQGGHVAVGDAGVGVPTRTPRRRHRRTAWRRPAAGAVDVGAGPGAASPEEALLGHDGTSEWDRRVPGRSRRPGPRGERARPSGRSGGPSSSRRSSAARGTSTRRPMRQTGSSPRLRGLVGQRPGDAEPPGGFGQRVGQPLLSRRRPPAAGADAGRVRSCCTWDLRSWCLAPGCSRHRRGHCLPSPACLTSSTRLRLACEDSRGLEPSQREPPDVGTTGRDVSGRPGLD